MILSLNYPYLVLPLPTHHFNFYSTFFATNTINDIFLDTQNMLYTNLKIQIQVDRSIDDRSNKDILYPFFF